MVRQVAAMICHARSTLRINKRPGVAGAAKVVSHAKVDGVDPIDG